MPPKTKFTKEEIVAKAMDVVRNKGMDCLTARELGAALGTSTRPIFTYFDSMEQVKQEVIEGVKQLYSDYVSKGLEMNPPFKGVGMQIVRFATVEKMFFKLLFMENTAFNSLYDMMITDRHYDRIVENVSQVFRLSKYQAEFVYHNLWTYGYGLAVMCATEACIFTDEELSEALGNACRCFVTGAKLDYDEHVKMMPAKNAVVDPCDDIYGI